MQNQRVGTVAHPYCFLFLHIQSQEAFLVEFGLFLELPIQGFKAVELAEGGLFGEEVGAQSQAVALDLHAQGGQGTGIYSTIVSLVRQLVMLLPAAWLLSRLGDVNLVWWAWPIAETSGLTMTVFFFLRNYRQRIKPLYND